MNLEQDLSVSITDCCDTIELCDTTCTPDPCNSTICTNGYGVDGNINKWDVEATEFNITFPDGNTLIGLDFGYIPNNDAYGFVEITAGTNGTISISLTGYGQIGIAFFDTDLATTAINLAMSINANSNISGFKALVDSTNPNNVFFFNTTDGAGANGAPIFIGVTGDMAGSSSGTISGGTDDPDCQSVTLSDIWSMNSGVVLNNNSGPSFADGVYVFEYVTYNADKTVELGRTSKNILFDCGVVSCLKETLLSESGCGCEGSLDERILKTRLKIEQARIQFDECLYDCANDTIIMAGEMCSDVCSEC